MSDSHTMSAPSDPRRFLTPNVLAIGAGLLVLAVVITTPLPLGQQLVLGVGAFIAAVALSRLKASWARVALAVSAFAIATRYIWWRITETLQFDSILEALLGYTMLGAELYLWVVLVLSFSQTLQGRDRKPAPLPADTQSWPTVDVFIPTYNEPLDIVAKTVLAAQQIEYPADKVKVYILDDGRRQEFAKFAADVGVGYIIRQDNKHAKAGNLNNALKETSGELVAIFDCDHVPVRGFLQLTVGWFLKDPRMALVQTPHYFYNRDPFEKNLASGDRLSNEGLLFYGLLQDGNDFWNASFFCGSCAVLRRTALEEVGGIAVETVTEDAHTSLRLQRRGWNSAFLRRPLAAGLATESLAIHIGQRMRWARGMIQIFRLDNPFFGPGLSLMQRVCYANAMIHFFFPLPRLLLLSMPLAFLVFGQQIIWANAWELLAYALPSLFVATIATTTLQGRHRQPFWGEIYEATLSFHLLRPTLHTIFQPRKGKFNVTAKGQRSGSTYLDWSVLKSQIAFCAVMVGAVLYGLSTVIFSPLPGDVVATTLINVVWAAISAAFIFMTIIVGREVREVRAEPRIATAVPATLHLGDGRAVAVQTLNVSIGGAQLKAPNVPDPVYQDMGVEMRDGAERIYVPARVVSWSKGDVRVAFSPENVEQKAGIVRIVLGRTTAWKGWDSWPQGSTANSFALIWDAMAGFAAWGGARLGQRLKPAASAASLALAVAAMLAVATPVAQAQTEAPAAEAFRSPAVAPQRSFGARGVNLALDRFGVLDPIRLQGRSNTRGLGFTLRADQVVNSARLVVPISYSPSLDPANSQLSVLLNGQTIHSVVLNPIGGTSSTLEFDVNPNLFLRDNNLVFKLTAKRVGQAAQCADDEAVWAEISNRAELRLSVDRLSLAPDLANLPMPFFDRRDASQLDLPFVFFSRPPVPVIQAASVVASYWGVESAYRGARFPVHFYNLPAADAVAFVTAEDKIAQFGWAEIQGPTLAIVPNPVSPQHRLLLVMGRTGEEMMAAARSLALGSKMLTGEVAMVQPPVLADRRAYDSPRWIPTDRPIKLGELVDADRLEGRGLSPGVLSANLRTAPDLFAANAERGVPMKVIYRTPGEQWIDLRKSRLDVLVNDSYIESLPLVETRKVGLLQRQAPSGALRTGDVMIPAHLIYGQTRLQFYFDLQTRAEGACPSEPGELRTAVDVESEIDLRGMHRFTRMPNLAFMAQSGFPFTRMADLSETAIVLSPDFSEKDLQALFQIMGSFGDKTGYPAVRATVVFPSDIAAQAEKDILVLGAYAGQPLVTEWAKHSAFEFIGDNVRVRSRPAIERVAGVVHSAFTGQPAADQIQLPTRSLPATMYSFQSPLAKKRTVVFIAAQDGDALVRLAEAATIGADVGRFQGDFVSLAGETITSLQVADAYHVGELPLLTALQWNLAQRPWSTPTLMGLSFLLVSFGTFGALQRRARSLKEADEGAPESE
jgi:cellulose synthase (UDP-forming)